MGKAVDLSFEWSGPAEAPVLVLSHALGLSRVMWQPQIDRFSTDFRVLRHDHRGHGASPIPQGPYAIAELGADLLQLLNRLKLDRVSFCGLSLGGMVGMWLAANVPDRIDHLILCCTAARMMRPDDYAVRADRVRRDGMASIVDAVLGRWFTPAFLTRQQRKVDWVRKLFLSTDADGYASTCEALSTMDLRPELRRIPVSTTVVAGAQDQATPPAQAVEIAERIPGAELVVVEEAGHLASLEQPDRFAEVVLEALRGRAREKAEAVLDAPHRIGQTGDRRYTEQFAERRGIEEMGKSATSHGVTRREMLKGTGLVVGGLAIPGVLESCLSPASSSTASGSIKIGYVSPITGPASGFGEPDAYVLGLARDAFKKGLTIGGTNYSVQIVSRDGQSTPSVGAQVANDLIQTEKVDLMLATSTPETVNPVSDACEAAGVPCISTVVPWEAWYLGRGAKPGQPSPFKWTFHYCFGVEQFYLAYTHLWPQVPTNKKVGVMWPNDADGNAIRGALGPLLKSAGYTIIDPGAYEDGTNDYTAQIQKFIAEDCQIFNTFPIPPDFATFWRQAAQQGYTRHVKIAQIAKTGLFPSQVTSLGSIGNGLASGVYWAPTWPYKSSLTGMTSKQLGDGYESATGKQWNQQLGASLSMFDVAAAVLNASGDPKNKTKVAGAMSTLKVETPVGNLDWSKPASLAGATVPNVVSTPIIGGQWKQGVSKWPIDFVICENSADANVPVAATLQQYSA